MKKFKTTDGIAPWKIDSPIERFLARKADGSQFWKKAYVRFYKVFDKEYYKKGLKLIDKYIHSFVGEVTPEKRKEYIYDMVYSLHRFGCMFDEYFLFGFENLNAAGKDSFITDKIRYGYYAQFNTDEANQLFNNKQQTYQLFRKYFKRDLIFVEGDKDRDTFLQFAAKHPSFIVKPCNSSGGKGVHILHTEGKDLDTCFNELLEKEAPIVCEELIVQSETMAAFHPASVNTVRLLTLRIGDEVRLYHSFFKTGIGGDDVDNAARGGIFALINPHTGTVCTEAKSKIGGKFWAHPDSGLPFVGFQLPDWDGAVALVKELALVVKENRYVGWDIAHTDQGWVMVEGNPRGQFIVQQAFFRTGFKAEITALIQELHEKES